MRAITELRIRIWNPIQPLIHPAVIVPIDEFFEYAAKVAFIPDQHPIKTLPTQGPYEPLNMSRSIGCA